MVTQSTRVHYGMSITALHRVSGSGTLDGHMGNLPKWIRVRLSAGGDSGRVSDVLERAGLNTVCHGAECPNRHECFGRGTATFMILGDTCTRSCAFCAVTKGKPAPPDPGEPERVARAAAELKLRHVVVTSVTRDDLPDGGAALFAATIRGLRAALPSSTVEVLTPDFKGSGDALATVLSAAPDVFNHNLETVERLQAAVRSDADYARSLAVLRYSAAWRPRVLVKSGLMVGLGESDAELYQAMKDLLEAGCRLLTIGQYLAPSKKHAPVARYVEPAVFDEYRRRAMEMGFSMAAAGPLVRSSYMAENMIGRLR